MLNGGWHGVEEIGPSGDVPAKLKLQPHLNFMCFSGGGRCFLGSSAFVGRTHTGSIWLFPDLELPLDSEKSLARHFCEAPVICGAFLNENRVIVADDTGSVVTFLLNETDGVNFVPHSYLTPHDSWINSLSVCFGLEEIITGGADSRICVLDDSGSSMKMNYYPAHGQAVTGVAASPSDNAVFVSSSMDRLTLLWDTRLPKPAKALVEGNCGYTAVAWKDEHNVAIGSESGMVHIHDIRSNQSVLDLPLHNTAVRKLVFNDSCLLASSSDSVEIRLWNFESGKMIFPESKHARFISDLAWKPENGSLYSCGLDGRVLSHLV